MTEIHGRIPLRSANFSTTFFVLLNTLPYTDVGNIWRSENFRHCLVLYESVAILKTFTPQTYYFYGKVKP